MVVEVSLYDRSQPLPSFRYGCVHPNPELLFDCLQLRPHSLARRLAAHGVIALPVLPATVGESQKIERPGFASPFPPPIVFRLLGDSFYGLKREAATGVDGVTWKEYETGLAERLRDLHGRVHRGAYRAQPSRRIYLKKADGRQRPIGIAALEDKIVQGAVVKILNQIYEEDAKHPR